MKMSEIFPSDYLRAADLHNREVTVRMQRVEVKELGGEPKGVLYFEDKQKGLVLNKTNAATICDAYGDEMDGWSGKDVVLFATKVDFQGKRVDAIRVRIQRPSADEPLAASSSEGKGEVLDDTIPF